jgi:hypothetical protein
MKRSIKLGVVTESLVPRLGPRPRYWNRPPPLLARSNTPRALETRTYIICLFINPSILPISPKVADLMDRKMMSRID